MAEQPPPSQPPAQTPPPQWAPQQQPPAWGQPPPGAWGQPGYSAPPPRPVLVLIGSIWLIVVGILQILAGAGCGLLSMGAGSLSSQDTSGLLGVLSGSLLVFGIIAVVLGFLQLASGVGALGGRGWARWIGILLSIMYFLVGLLILLGLGISATLGLNAGAPRRRSRSSRSTRRRPPLRSRDHEPKIRNHRRLRHGP